jgi:hypothetical protein
MSNSVRTRIYIAIEKDVREADRKFQQCWEMFGLGNRVEMFAGGYWVAGKGEDILLDSSRALVRSIGRKYVELQLGDGDIVSAKANVTVIHNSPYIEIVITPTYTPPPEPKKAASYQERCRRTGRGNYFDRVRS